MNFPVEDGLWTACWTTKAGFPGRVRHLPEQRRGEWNRPVLWGYVLVGEGHPCFGVGVDALPATVRIPRLRIHVTWAGPGAPGGHEALQRCWVLGFNAPRGLSPEQGEAWCKQSAEALAGELMKLGVQMPV